MLNIPSIDPNHPSPGRRCMPGWSRQWRRRWGRRGRWAGGSSSSWCPWSSSTSRSTCTPGCQYPRARLWRPPSQPEDRVMMIWTRVILRACVPVGVCWGCWGPCQWGRGGSRRGSISRTVAVSPCSFSGFGWCLVIARVERIAMCCILGVHVIYCKEIKAKTGIIMSIDYEHIAVKSFRTNCDFSFV